MESHSKQADQEAMTKDDADVARSAPSTDSIPQSGFVTWLVERWQQESRQQRLPFRIAGSLMIAVGGGLFLFELTLDKFSSLLTMISLYMIAGALFVMKGIGFVFPLTKVQQQIKADIEAIDDGAVAVELAAYVASNQLNAADPLREAALTTLTRLLSNMSAEDAVVQFRYNIDKLGSLMTNRMAAGHPDLVIAILRLPPAIVDIVATARFIVDDAPTRNEQRVRETAQEVLPGLLASRSFGGQEFLTNWIRRLPAGFEEQPTVPIEMILPHLAIMKLLPQTSPDAFLALSQHTRRRLYANTRQILLPRLFQYQLAVLDMIRRSADVEALSTVQALTGGIFVSPYPQVRAAARACAVVLKAQLEKEKVSKTLLRGATAPEAAPDTLLRAASGGTAADPQLLLRANVEESRGESIAGIDRLESAARPAPAGELERDATLRLHNGQR